MSKIRDRRKPRRPFFKQLDAARADPARRLQPGTASAVAAAVAARLPDAERIRALAQHAQAESIAFQSIVAAALQVLERALRHEQQVAKAAISLAQREKLQRMTGQLENLVQALRETLSASGRQVVASRQDRALPPLQAGDRQSWWFALTEAIHVLEEGRDWITAVVAGQPKGGAARTLGSILARLLHRHHNVLLAEADHWIS